MWKTKHKREISLDSSVHNRVEKCPQKIIAKREAHQMQKDTSGTTHNEENWLNKRRRM